MALCMNNCFDDNGDFLIETKKWKMTVETLKERLDKLTIEIDEKVNGATKSAEGSEAALKRVVVKNVNLEAIQKSQVNKIKS